MPLIDTRSSHLTGGIKMSDTHSSTTQPLPSRNQDLAEAFEHIANAHKTLDDAMAVGPDESVPHKKFHSDAWKRAFYNLLDQIGALQTASPRDAATLGVIFCNARSSLIDELIEIPANEIRLSTLMDITNYDEMQAAKAAFERVLSDLDEGLIWEDGTTVEHATHELLFGDEKTLQHAFEYLKGWEFEDLRMPSSALLIQFDSEYLLSHRTQSEIARETKCTQSTFNIRPDVQGS
jgi:hypothetical protein